MIDRQFSFLKLNNERIECLFLDFQLSPWNSMVTSIGLSVRNKQGEFIFFDSSSLFRVASRTVFFFN